MIKCWLGFAFSESHIHIEKWNKEFTSFPIFYGLKIIIKISMEEKTDEKIN